MLGNGLPIVLVIISGRPLLIDSYLGNANLKAAVAAWLPGSEGGGVANVLWSARASGGPRSWAITSSTACT
jgi:beta-glucosidase